MQILVESLMQRIKRSFQRLEGPVVDFIIGGTQKGGTSALDAYLREHPNICMANQKEVHFFDDERIYQHKVPDYSIYHNYFSPEPPQHLIGEATPSYMYWRDVPRRIWEYNHGMKFLIILRNPIERAFSHWNMQRSKNLEPLSFWDAIRTEEQRCREALPFQHRRYSYIDRGFYSEQLRRLWAFFPKEKVMVLRNEELRNSPVETLQKVFEFLELTCLQNVETKNVHSNPYLSKMGNREKEYLSSIFENEIKSLERMLDWDCSEWFL